MSLLALVTSVPIDPRFWLVCSDDEDDDDDDISVLTCVQLEKWRVLNFVLPAKILLMILLK